MDQTQAVGANAKSHPLDVHPTKDALGAVILHWFPIIADWAIRKKWMDLNSPRDPLGLLMLVHTEQTELEQAIAKNDLANVREEIADIAIRLIQMLAEHSLPVVSSDTRVAGLDIDASLSAAAEVWRNRTQLGELVWRGKMSAEIIGAIEALCRLHIGRIWDGSLGSIWYALHMMIAEKMAINEGRAIRHGKDA